MLGRHLPEELTTRSSEDQLQSQGHGANPAAEKLVRSEKIGVGWQRESLCRRCGCNAGGTEDVAVAKGEVGVVQDVKDIRFGEQIFSLAEEELLSQ